MSKKITKKVVGSTDSKLQDIAKRNNVSMEVILKQFDEVKTKLKEQNVTVNLELLAVNAVMNIYRRQKASQVRNTGKKKEVTTVYGFITGDSGIWDKAEQVRRAAKKYIDKNGLQAAIEAQIIDGDNNILDRREKLYGRDNPNYLKALPQDLHVLERTLYGFFSHNGHKVYKYGSIQTSDNRLARGWGKVKFFTPCQVQAVIKEEDETSITLSSSSADETMSIFKGIKEDIDVKAVIDATLEKLWTPISGVEDFHKIHEKEWNRKLFIKGVVAWINIDRPTAYGTIKMGLMNPDNEDDLVIVEIPEVLTIDFGELSEVYVFGKTKVSKYYNEDKELVDGDVIVTATGIFPTIPTPRGNTSSSNGRDETPVEGWID